MTTELIDCFSVGILLNTDTGFGLVVLRATKPECVSTGT